MMHRAGNPEWTKYYLIGEGNEVAALHARFVAHRYARHAHEHCVVGLIESGVQSYSYRGSRHVTTAGEIFVVNPGEAHTGEAATPTGYVYRSLCVRPRFLERTLGELGNPIPSVYLKGAVHTDCAVARSLSAFHRMLSRGATNLEQETTLLRALVLLFTRYSELGCAMPRAGREPQAVARAREYLEAHFAQNASLTDVARAVGLSPYYFSRVFEKTVGLPPHAYVEGVRIRNACGLISRGETIASAALAVGYADQSHLTKRFKRILGITPRQYLRHR